MPAQRTTKSTTRRKQPHRYCQSRYQSEWTPLIQRFPNEILHKIIEELDYKGYQSALRVCRSFRRVTAAPYTTQRNAQIRVHEIVQDHSSLPKADILDMIVTSGDDDAGVRAFFAEHGTEIQSTNASKSFIRAVERGHAKVADYLIKKQGVSVDTLGDFNLSAIHIAAQRAHDKVVSVLYNNGTNVNTRNPFRQTPLHLAARAGNVDFIRWFVKNFPVDVEAKDDRGDTPLQYAVAEKNEQLVRLFVYELGANPNTIDIYGRTPLHHTAIDGSVNIAKLLVTVGADPSTRDGSTQTPFHYAVERKQKNVAKYLLDTFGTDSIIQFL